ncbi:hypothetical protein EG329_013907 [Mollisiaceae sp. DMI_Dod_QoI]|nr:hypothetical protein EG329_013907 [Helotiales sp. DMI_Dod_QoI]
MGVYKTTWAASLIIEAMKFWFYSIVLSLLLSVVGIWELYTSPPTKSLTTKPNTEKDERNEEDSNEETEQTKADAKVGWMNKRRKAMKGIVIDICDLSVPGSITGWLPVSSANVGMLGVVSTLLAGADVWTRIQNHT